MSLLNQGNHPQFTGTESHPAGHQDSNDTHQNVDWEKRYKDLQSYADKTRVSLERQIGELRQQATSFVAPRTKEELELFKQQNPDHFGTIETVADMMIQDRIAPLQQELRSAKQRQALAQIREAHPDFATIVNSPEFQAWAEQEGPEIQAWLEEEIDASKPIRALTYYKAVAGYNRQAPVVQPTQDYSAAQAVNLRGGSPNPTGTEGLRSYTRDQIERMSVVEYEANIESIQRAHAAGLIS
ncbi:hypothetical protein [Pseudoalteromonas phage vB_PtuP_Slicky01]|nr:hypothetical protein [Pseudoalteromonas phage vB_PtuP_Slicky01]